MFGIPSWAVGVMTIMTFIGLVQVLVGWAQKRLGLQSWRQRARGRTVIGMTLPGDSGDSGTAHDSGEQSAALDDMQRRLAELEERVDFAERLLAQQKEASQLNPPRR